MKSGRWDVAGCAWYRLCVHDTLIESSQTAASWAINIFCSCRNTIQLCICVISASDRRQTRKRTERGCRGWWRRRKEGGSALTRPRARQGPSMTAICARIAPPLQGRKSNSQASPPSLHHTPRGTGSKYYPVSLALKVRLWLAEHLGEGYGASLCIVEIRTSSASYLCNIYYLNML